MGGQIAEMYITMILSCKNCHLQLSKHFLCIFVVENNTIAYNNNFIQFEIAFNITALGALKMRINHDKFNLKKNDSLIFHLIQKNKKT